MTIDERLDKLTERHEALAQSVELLTAAQQKTEQHLDRLTGIVESFISHVSQLLQSHEARLDRLEGR